MKPRVLFLLALASTSLGTNGAHGDLVVMLAPTPPSRGVTAAATYAAPDSDVSMAPGIYTHTASAMGSGLAGTISATATQSSITPATVGLSMSGTGDVAADAVATGMDGFSVSAESFFDVFFEVDVAGIYSLTADVSWTGTTPPFGGGAAVLLKDVTLPMMPMTLSVIEKTAVDQGMASLATLVSLSPGIDYELLAKAVIDGGFATAGPYSATGHWSFELSAIPEASSMIAMTPLALVAAFCAWRSRRHDQRDDHLRRRFHDGTHPLVVEAQSPH